MGQQFPNDETAASPGSSFMVWLRALRPRHVVTTGAAVTALVMLDELSGITPPFERLSYFLGRGLAPTGIYVAVVLALSLSSVLLLRTRLRWLSLALLLLFSGATMVETVFDVFTDTGFSEDWVAISMRELGLAPEAARAYVDGRVLAVAGIGVAIWIGLWVALRSERWLLRGSDRCGRQTVRFDCGGRRRRRQWRGWRSID